MYKYTGSVLAIGDDPVRLSQNRLNFRIYPNPVSEKLFVECKRNIDKPLQYTLYDLAGKAVLQERSIRDRFEINVQFLSRAVYFLKIFNAYDIGVALEKIIVN